jgi:hypothetical protein
VENSLSNISDYLNRKIVDVRLARLLGEAIWALGSCISAAGLLLRTLILVVIGFPILFFGLYLSVHFELQRLDYVQAMERIMHQES